MRIVDAAEQYCRERGVARTVVFSANRLVKHLGVFHFSELNSTKLAEFQAKASCAGLSAWTIKGTLKDIGTVASHFKISLEIPVVRVPRPTPSPTELSVINAIWPHIQPWCKQWLGIAFWTALRLDDSIELQVLGPPTGQLRYQASKTGHSHVWPFPDWLRRLWQPTELPYQKATDHAQVLIRNELQRASLAARTERVVPKEIRQAALNAWAKSHATAGAIVHGCGLGVLAHYLDPLQILESAAPRVRLPECFGACTQAGTEDTLISNFRRLDPAAQSLIVGTTERLAAS